jgi:integrase
MKLKLRDGIYYAVFEDLAGNRRRLSTGTKDIEAARIKGRDLMRQVMLAVETPAAPATVTAKALTLTDSLESCLRLRWSKQKSGTERRYTVRALQRTIGYWPLHSITYKKLQDHCEYLLGEEVEDAPATVNRKMSAIGTALRESAKREEIPAAPSIPHYAENNIRERYLTRAEESTIHGWLSRQAVPDPDYAYMRDLFVVLLDGGFRCTEALEIEAQRFDGCRVTMVHGSGADEMGTTKNGRGRVVPLTDRARAALARMLASEFHGKVDSDWVGRRWRTCMANVGIEGVTVHTLRHTCASRLIQGKVDIYLVSKWLGHSSLEITKRYAHLAVDSLDVGAAALAKFGAVADTVKSAGRVPDTVLAALGTLSEDKLLSLLAMIGAKGETRTRTGYPTRS